METATSQQHSHMNDDGDDIIKNDSGDADDTEYLQMIHILFGMLR